MDIPFWVAIPVVALLIPITAIITDAWKTVREREHSHRERLKGIEMGLVESLPPSPARSENGKSGKSAPRSPGFYGSVWTGLGAGLLLSTLLVQKVGNNEGMITFSNFLMLWSFPALGVGVALLVFSATLRKRRDPSEGGSV